MPFHQIIFVSLMIKIAFSNLIFLNNMVFFYNALKCDNKKAISFDTIFIQSLIIEAKRR